jgi:hypothetical protein
VAAIDCCGIGWLVLELLVLRQVLTAVVVFDAMIIM